MVIQQGLRKVVQVFHPIVTMPEIKQIAFRTPTPAERELVFPRWGARRELFSSLTCRIDPTTLGQVAIGKGTTEVEAAGKGGGETRWEKAQATRSIPRKRIRITFTPRLKVEDERVARGWK